MKLFSLQTSSLPNEGFIFANFITGKLISLSVYASDILYLIAEVSKTFWFFCIISFLFNFSTIEAP
ncbi:hypothetical protein HX021_18630 [Sphingobacterium sp. N143]|uniref:hypothetical protein n=1 Tax=Sphingobacterium sp. N143 TaxID=2746727 RepID=UPI002577289C|nr:hypothetical protein [Sphingobacterium sp. N143]MDM1296305.1 hypothetical protein [Sphingobacterium sp. N143]